MKRLTTKEFIKKAKDKHDNKYNYYKTIYKLAKINIIISCKIHGDFIQTPDKHLHGHGCQKCSNIIRGKKLSLSTKDFIKKANKIHKYNYLYKKVNYISSQKKVIITCKEHGDFLQIPSSHLMGCGCKKCATKINISKRSYNNDLFIKKAKQIHGNLYSYKNLNYISSQKKVIITCKEHGDFLQIPNNHLRGKGCYKCGGTHQLTTKDFIKMAHNVHNNLYVYCKTKYDKNHLKVIITCKEHGDFLQSPDSHLHGRGCQKCANLNRNFNKKNNAKNSFIEKVNKKHNFFYNYSKTTYESAMKKIIIICPIHNVFHQTPADHLAGYGCPKCGANHLTQSKIFNLIKSYFHGNTKIMEDFKHSSLKFQKTNRKMQLDIWAPTLNLGIEYHGGQHYKEIPHFHKTKNCFSNAQARDQEKILACRKNKIKLLTIPYYAWDNNPEKLKVQIQKLLDSPRYHKVYK